MDSRAIAEVGRATPQQIADPAFLQSVAKIADAFVKSGLVPDSYARKGKMPLPPGEVRARLMIGIMKSYEVGLPPVTGINTIAIINGRPSIWGDGAMALVRQSGEVAEIKEYFEGEIASDNFREWPDDYAAVCEMRRKGTDGATTRRFSIADARRANLWGNTNRDPWVKYPQRMLAARARAWAIRDTFADVLSGLSIMEEQQDIPMKDITPVDTSFLDDEPAKIEAPMEAGLTPHELVQVLDIAPSGETIDALVEANKATIDGMDDAARAELLALITKRRAEIDADTEGDGDSVKEVSGLDQDA